MLLTRESKVDDEADHLLHCSLPSPDRPLYHIISFTEISYDQVIFCDEYHTPSIIPSIGTILHVNVRVSTLHRCSIRTT